MLNPSSWSLVYDVHSQATTRILVSLPLGLMKDARVLAQQQNISVSEAIRRTLTEKIASIIRENPDMVSMFEGTLPT